MNKNVFYLTVLFITISVCAQSQSFNNQINNSQSKAFALLDLGFNAKLLHINTEGSNTVVKKEEVKKSPRSLEEIIANSKSKKSEEDANFAYARKYDLVVGCFSNINNAQHLVSKLNDQGQSSKIVGQNNLGLHVVVYGTYKSKSDARTVQKALFSEGVSSWIKTN